MVLRHSVFPSDGGGMDWIIDPGRPGSTDRTLDRIGAHLRRHTAPDADVATALERVRGAMRDLPASAEDALLRVHLDWAGERPRVELGAITDRGQVATTCTTGRRCPRRTGSGSPRSPTPRRPGSPWRWSGRCGRRSTTARRPCRTSTPTRAGTGRRVQPSRWPRPPPRTPPPTRSRPPRWRAPCSPTASSVPPRPGTVTRRPGCSSRRSARSAATPGCWPRTTTPWRWR